MPGEMPGAASDRPGGKDLQLFPTSLPCADVTPPWHNGYPGRRVHSRRMRFVGELK